MNPNDVAFSVIKNKRAMKQAAAQPGQMNLTQPSPQTNLDGESAGLQSEVSQYIQRLEEKQKELKQQEKDRAKYEEERAGMMQPGQQSLPQPQALPQPDQDIQQVVNDNQQELDTGYGFKRGLIEEMEMLGMIKKKDEEPLTPEEYTQKRRQLGDSYADAQMNPDHPAKTNPTSYDMQGKPIQGDREIEDAGRPCEHCGEGHTIYTDDGAVGCSTEDCVANTPEMLQDHNLPHYKTEKLTEQKVGEVTPTRTSQTDQDRDPNAGGPGIAGLFPMAPDPNFEPNTTIDAPRPQQISQLVDEQGNPSTTMQGMRHPDIRAGEPMDIAMRLLKEDMDKMGVYIGEADADKRGFRTHHGEMRDGDIEDHFRDTRNQNRFRGVDADRDHWVYNERGKLKFNHTAAEEGAYEGQPSSVTEIEPGDYMQGGSVPRRQPADKEERMKHPLWGEQQPQTGTYIGADVRGMDDSDESIDRFSNTMGHEYTHEAIDGEINDWLDETHGPEEEEVKLKYPAIDDDDDDDDFDNNTSSAIRELLASLEPAMDKTKPPLNQKEHDESKERRKRRDQIRTFAHEFGAHQSDQNSREGVAEYLSQRSDTKHRFKDLAKKPKNQRQTEQETRLRQQPRYTSVNDAMTPQTQQQAQGMTPQTQQQSQQQVAQRLQEIQGKEMPIQTGEPMDIAMQLLKDDELPNFCGACQGSGCEVCDNTGLGSSERFHQEHEPMSEDDMVSYYDERELGKLKNSTPSFPTTGDTRKDRLAQTDVKGNTYQGEPTFNMTPLAGAGRPMINPHAEIFRRGEPMDIAMRLLKEAVSPEAKKHKHDYDTKYESSPERRKYRTELTQERRNRGVAGKGGKDMSHTARGTIVPEDMHANRARHFKERGTLKKTVLVKAQKCPTPSKKAYSDEEEAYQDASLMGNGYGVYPCPCGAYHFTSS